MGYTHYWSRPKQMPVHAFKAAADDCRKVVDTISAELDFPVQWESDDPTPAFFDRNGIRFNGRGDDGAETFSIDRVFTVQEWDGGSRGPWSDFCKTFLRPYDSAVCACLVVLKQHFGKKFDVSSDGDDYEEGWSFAREFCQRVLGYGRDFSLVSPFGEGGALLDKDGKSRGDYDEVYFRGGLGGRVHVGHKGHFAREKEGTWDGVEWVYHERTGKRVALYSEHPTGRWGLKGLFDTVEDARWLAAVNYIAYVAKSVGAHDYEPFVESLKPQVGDWHGVSVFCDFLDEQGEKGRRVRLLLPEACALVA